MSDTINSIPESLKTGNSYKADQIRKAIGIGKMPKQIAEQYLKEIKNYEDQGIELMSRMSLGEQFSEGQRRLLFKQLIKFWKNELEAKEITLIVFNISPHSIEELTLFFAAKLIRRPCIIFQTTSVKELVYVTSDLSMKKLNSDWKYSHITPSKLRVKEDILFNHLSKMRRNFIDVKPWFYETSYPTKSSIKIRFTNKRKGRKTQNVNIFPFVHKLTPLGVERRYSFWLTLLLKYYSLKNAFKNRKLQKFYRRHCKFNFDLKSKFIYVPLHFQPERTSLPEGCEYYDQLKLVKLISKLAGTSITIAVKEHKTQFNSALPFDQHRSKQFYQKLSKLKNVVLLSEEQNSVELIDNSLCVATITGTAGWEALCRGVPVLAFGTAWYRDCFGAFYGFEETYYKDALKKIIRGITIDKQYVDQFLLKLSRFGLNAYTTASYSQGSELSTSENIDALSTKILQIIKDMKN
ncbi:capsular biosynthesis protein [Paracoccaceae bacterium]|nr:capsular biosynthesis protein [Paracoccaceae bacterium]